MQGFVVFYQDPTVPNPAVRDRPSNMYVLQPYPRPEARAWWGQDGIHVFATETEADEAIAHLTTDADYPLRKLPADALPWLW